MMPSVDLPNSGNVWQNHTAYQQVISTIGSLNHRKKFKLSNLHIIHVLPKRAPYYVRMCVLLDN